MNAFVEAVATGDQRRVWSGPDKTLASHRIVFAAERARRERKVVTLAGPTASQGSKAATEIPISEHGTGRAPHDRHEGGRAYRQARKAEVPKGDMYQDEWGTTYQKDAASWPIDAPIDYPIKTRADLKGYRPPDPTLPGCEMEIVAAREMENDGIAQLGGVQGPLTTAWLLMGCENISFALYEDPELLGDVFRVSDEFFKEAARRSVAAGSEWEHYAAYRWPEDFTAGIRGMRDGPGRYRGVRGSGAGRSTGKYPCHVRGVLPVWRSMSPTTFHYACGQFVIELRAYAPATFLRQ